jgi:hypothetical protein
MMDSAIIKGTGRAVAAVSNTTIGGTKTTTAMAIVTATRAVTQIQ